MNYRPLPRTDLRVSVIALGSYLTYGQHVDLDRSRACVRAALDAGINFFDTADSYGDGEAERVLGALLREARRGDVVIATKCFFPWAGDPTRKGLSRAHVREAAERSRRNLGVDVIDLFQCHRYDPDVPLEETVSALDELVREGRIRAWGVSQWSAAQISAAVAVARAQGAATPATDQPAYHLLRRDIERDVLPACRAAEVAVLAYAPLAQGALTGKYAAGEPPPGSRAADPKLRAWMYHVAAGDLARVRALEPIARDAGVSLAQLALAWCIRDEVVASAIVGASRPEQVAENARASDAALSAEVWTRVDAALSRDESP